MKVVVLAAFAAVCLAQENAADIGKGIFRIYCAACHGFRAQGGRPKAIEAEVGAIGLLLFAEEHLTRIQKELVDLENKLRNLAVVSNEHVPEDMVFLGHTVKLLDLDDDSEQLVRLVGEAQPPSADSDVLPVSTSSPMGEALMKSHVGDTIKVKAPRGTMEFKVLEIVS